MLQAPYLEPLVLEHSLDGGILTRRRELGLEDDAKRAVAHYLTLGVLHLLRLAGETILHLLANHLWDACQLVMPGLLWAVKPHTTHAEAAEAHGSARRHDMKPRVSPALRSCVTAGPAGVRRRDGRVLLRERAGWTLGYSGMLTLDRRLEGEACCRGVDVQWDDVISRGRTWQALQAM